MKLTEKEYLNTQEDAKDSVYFLLVFIGTYQFAQVNNIYKNKKPLQKAHKQRLINLC